MPEAVSFLERLQAVKAETPKGGGLLAEGLRIATMPEVYAKLSDSDRQHLQIMHKRLKEGINRYYHPGEALYDAGFRKRVHALAERAVIFEQDEQARRARAVQEG